MLPPTPLQRAPRLCPPMPRTQRPGKQRKPAAVAFPTTHTPFLLPLLFFLQAPPPHKICDEPNPRPTDGYTHHLIRHPQPDRVRGPSGPDATVLVFRRVAPLLGKGVPSPPASDRGFFIHPFELSSGVAHLLV
ncbi:hypothetical protein CCHR01_04069 [Colletotrichum chrysophilum]|uniref:Uncharacterized protein n=1 Tax=Colletotrichum chrysophilum TaxID=1836956 RepID=A0AAD9ASL0_9PEZI|nr:hypothetical protein CCHR01_04069 [Colletotrichum chrysophilum]